MTPRQIIDTVAEYYYVTPEEILGPRRETSIVRARQAAMYLMRRRVPVMSRGMSLGRIGEIMGRNHTTVLHGVNVVEAERQRDPEFRRQLEILEHDIESASARAAAGAA